MFQGSMVAMVTPMLDGGAVDYAALARLVEFHIEAGTDVIVAVGTTGESATLTHEENCRVVEKVVDLVGGRIPVIAGTGANSTHEALHLTGCAKKAGADACLLVTPYYNKPTQEGLYRHFMTVADQVDVPQILYNVPGRTACDMKPDTVVRLHAHERIVGIKEASGEIDRVDDLVGRCKQGFMVLSGEDALACETMLRGGKGVISVTANVAPALMHEMAVLALQGDRDGAEKIDQRLADLHAAMFIEPNPIPAKWALRHMGMIGAHIRLPMTELTEASRPAVAAALATLQN